MDGQINGIYGWMDGEMEGGKDRCLNKWMVG